jgi:hypothetical protein
MIKIVIFLQLNFLILLSEYREWEEFHCFYATIFLYIWEFRKTPVLDGHSLLYREQNSINEWI